MLIKVKWWLDIILRDKHTHTHSPDVNLSVSEQCLCQSSADADRQYGGEDACQKEKGLNEMTDCLAVPLLRHLHCSLSPHISPTAAWEAMTSLTPVSHTLRRDREASSAALHVTTEQH